MISSKKLTRKLVNSKHFFFHEAGSCKLYTHCLVMQVLVVSDIKQDLGYMGSHSRHRAWRSVIYLFLVFLLYIHLELNSCSLRFIFESLIHVQLEYSE